MVQVCCVPGRRAIQAVVFIQGVTHTLPTACEAQPRTTCEDAPQAIWQSPRASLPLLNAQQYMRCSLLMTQMTALDKATCWPPGLCTGLNAHATPVQHQLQCQLGAFAACDIRPGTAAGLKETWSSKQNGTTEALRSAHSRPAILLLHASLKTASASKVQDSAYAPQASTLSAEV